MSKDTFQILPLPTSHCDLVAKAKFQNLVVRDFIESCILIFAGGNTGEHEFSWIGGRLTTV